MTDAVIVSASRTPIGTAYKGTLTETSALELADVVVAETVRRSGLPPERFDDVVLGESMWGGGDIARHAAITAGMVDVPGVAVNRHCASGLTSVSIAAANIRAGMDEVVLAGGVQSSSTAPRMRARVLGTEDEWTEPWMSPSHPGTAEAPSDDMSITVGWNAAKIAGVTREEMDAWALRSHQRAVAAIDNGLFTEEIVPVKARRRDGSLTDFAVDEHPRRGSTLEKLASLKPLHPEIDGFSITAGNSSGINDAAAALALASDTVVAAEGLTPLAIVRGWASVGVDPVRTGLAPVDAVRKALRRSGVRQDEIALWEINEAFASVCVATTRILGIDEENVNTSGSGCSLGHPVAASGARMLTTLVHELRRRGGGYGVAAMCAGGGQAGAVVVEVLKP
ncbi:thiolase family protein [Amycolatopsis sp.]|uniref:thiolase family protein n=1 Tax=Amycolatopsis sp. TaxID=37632 RepID=UPI002BF8AC58|nr:thiolase family protein [Amycolatopsis sp.]HVV12646.1 thiolase family protein [Amycolatopsis sp.]